MAAEDTIKTRLSLEGEKEYRDAVTAIGVSLREADSEMKIVTATFGKGSTSIEALTQTSDVLNKKLDEQNKKVEAVTTALERMKKEGVDENSAAFIKMQSNLNNATAEMITTENQIKDITSEMEKAAREADDFGDELNQAGDESNTAGNKFAAAGNVIGTAGKAIGSALVAVGAAAAAAASALIASTISTSNYVDDLVTTSIQTRQTTQDLQEYAYAARFIDFEMDTLTKTMAKNVQAMDNAREGSAAYSDAYNKLGVAVTNADGTLRDSNDVYWDTIDALKEVANETERDALAMTLFGRSAQDINTVIEAGSEAFEKYGAEAEKMGTILSKDAIAALGEFNDKTQVIAASMDGLKNNMSLVALPFLDSIAGEVIPMLADFSTGIQNANGDMAKMGEVIGTAISGAVQIFADQIPQFIDMGVSIVGALIDGVAQNATGIATAAVQISQTLINSLADIVPVALTAAIDFVVALATGIGNALPEVVPAVTEIIVGIVETLVDSIPEIIDAALVLITGLADGILQAVPVIVEALPTLITGIIDGLLQAIPMIIDAGLTIFNGLVEAIPLIIPPLVEAIPQIIDSVVTTLTTSVPLIIDATIALLNGIIQAMPIIIPEIIAAIPQIFIAINEAFISNIPAMINLGVEYLSAIVENVPQILTNIGQSVLDIVFGIKSKFSEMRNTFLDIGNDIVGGIWQGIQNMHSTFMANITGFFTGIVDSVKSTLQIASPSKVFEKEIGENMIAGVGSGWLKGVKKVEDEMNKTIPFPSLNDTPYNPRKPQPQSGGTIPQSDDKANVNVTVYQEFKHVENDYKKQQREAAKRIEEVVRKIS